jgi:hypothetical protein
VPDPGRIPAQLASQPARGGDEAVRRLGRWIGRRSTARVRHPRRPSHARDELGLELGFRDAGAYQGRRSQTRVGGGQVEVGEVSSGGRSCMQGREVGAVILQCSVI